MPTKAQCKSATTTAKARYELVAKKISEARRAAAALAEEAFREGAGELFDRHLILQKFRWQQYTPYFNDGSACIFSVNSNMPDINDIDGWDLSRVKIDPLKSSLLSRFEGIEDQTQALQKAQIDVAEFLGSFNDNDMLSMFGDHKEITVHRENIRIEIDDYDHD